MNTLFLRAVVCGCWVGALAWPGCDPDEGRSFELELVTSPAAQANTCPASGAGGLVKTGPEGVRAIRVTFFDAAAGPPSVGSFVCDRLVAADQSGSTFYVKAGGRGSLHVQVDAFGDGGDAEDATRLVASGSLSDVQLGSGETPRIFLPMAGRLGCTLSTMSEARAFHSATALPGRRVLVVGGLVAARGESREVDEGTGLYLTDRIDLYDGETGQFVQPLLAGEPGIRRAFHDAFLMPGATQAQARVLLLGGVGQGTVPEAAGVVRVRQGPDHPFRLTPAVEAAAAAAEILTVDFGTDPPTVTRSRAGLDAWPARFFQGGASYGQGGACIAGGARQVQVGGIFATESSVDLGYPDTGEHYPLAGSLLVPRVGLTLSPVSSAVALAWGGNLGQLDPLGTLAERIAISPAPPSATALGWDEPSSTLAAPVATVFHTITPLDDGDFLWVGGFELEAGLALNPTDATAIHRIHLSTDDFFSLHGQDATGFVPVGYHAAVKLADGRVLITGGSPRNLPGVTPCYTGQYSWTCSMTQAFLYTPGVMPWDADRFEPLPDGGLVVPRFGHRMVLLDDGMVLVTGGLSREGDLLRTEASAEVLNPRQATVVEDDPLGRPPGALFSAESECPVY